MWINGKQYSLEKTIKHLAAERGKIPIHSWPGQALESTQRGLNLPCP